LTSDVLRNIIKHHENDFGFGESCFGGVEVLEEQGRRIPWELGFAPFG
jgi:two-component SAPR family response regulator